MMLERCAGPNKHVARIVIQGARSKCFRTVLPPLGTGVGEGSRLLQMRRACRRRLSEDEGAAASRGVAEEALDERGGGDL
eukprot:5425824-Pleurochrysis_carterae.AAC.1